MGLSPTVMRWATVGCKPVTPTSAGALARVPLYAVAHCCAAHGTATQLRTRTAHTTIITAAAAVSPSSFLHRLLMLASSASSLFARQKPEAGSDKSSSGVVVALRDCVCVSHSHLARVAHIYEQSLVFRKRTAGRSEMTVGLKIDASR
jgi:hypothetical protein